MNNILMLFIFVPILALILLFLNLLLAPHAPYEAKVSGYECGYQSIPGQTRSTFQIQFFLVALLFLVFDLVISIVGIIVSVISASYYLKIIRVLHSTPTATSDLLEGDLAIGSVAPKSSLLVLNADERDGLTEQALVLGQKNTNRAEGSTGKTLGSEEINQPNKSNINKIGAGADAAAAEGPKGAPIATIITSSHSFLISTLTLSILLFVLKPSILLNSTQLLSLSLFYY